jgi:hypothetical protein
VFHWLLAAAALTQIPAIDAPVVVQYSARYADLKVGSGPPAGPGKVLVVHYTLWLPDGKKIDSSVDRGTPFSFEQGKRRVIAGWEAGFEGMRVGGKRRLFVPYQLGYGIKGRGEIPPKSELIFDIELLDVREPEPLRTAIAPPGGHFEGISESMPTGSASISKEALAAAYRMNSLTPAGLLRDFSGNGNHGVVQADRVALLSSKAFDLDGPLTLAVRARLNSAKRPQELLVCAEKFGLGVTPEAKPRFADAAGGFQAFDDIKTGEWHSIVAIFRGVKGDPLSRKNLSVFVDGREVDGRLDSVWQPGKLKDRDACVIGPVDGEIEDLLLFGRAISEAEVGAHAVRRPSAAP